MTSVTLSVILTTIGRPNELQPLLDSLVRAASTGLSFEFLMTDQSDDLANITFIESQQWSFPVHTTTSHTGRLGGAQCRSCDRAWHLLLLPRRHLVVRRRCPVSGGDAAGERPQFVRAERDPAYAGRAPIDAALADRGGSGHEVESVPRPSIEPTLFVRAEVMQRVGRFDETMGTGSSQGYGSGEGTDLILRIIEQSGPVAFDPDVVICHPEPRDDLPADFTRKMAAYGAGFGRLYADHPLPKSQLGWLLGRKVAAAAVHRLTGHKALAQSDWAFLTGAVAGYRRRRR